MKISVVFLLAMVMFVSLPPGYATENMDLNEGRKLFEDNCSQCHTMGKGRKVGPDLYAITEIRPTDYLLDMISNATHVFETGNPIAVMVLGLYRTIRMPALNLSREQGADILAYIRAESTRPWPAAREEPVAGRPDTGKMLFDGGVSFKKGGPPCISCHNIARLPFPMGGTMGPDLTNINARFAAENAPHVFPTMVPLYMDRPLLPEEQVDLEAFIAKAAFEQSDDVTAVFALLAELVFVLATAVVWLIWRNRTGVVRDSLRQRGVPQRDWL